MPSRDTTYKTGTGLRPTIRCFGPKTRRRRACCSRVGVAIVSFWLVAGHAAAQDARRLDVSSTPRTPVSSERVPGVADACLRDCVMRSLDRGFAVGDRGLILSTEDGGKTWQVAAPRSDQAWYAIGFDPVDPIRPSGNGLIVGGLVEPISGRSHGTITITQDDGKTWNAVSVPGLPRLTGIQNLGPRHWIAWGDWSDHWQSALFETTDGGKTWSGRPNPCGHLHSAAVDAQGTTLIVDRGGRAYRSDDGFDFQPLNLTTDLFRPIRFCRRTPDGWWMGGEHGQLYFSNDSLNWKAVSVPGDAFDRELIALRDLESSGDHLWLIGEPGTVVWHSADRGVSWQTIATGQSTPLLAIAAWDENVLMACGGLGTVLISRNTGLAWWPSHRSGERLACLAIASTEGNVPWDVLAYVTHEGKRRASAVVLHDQHFHQAVRNQPEMSQRIASVGSALFLEDARVLNEFPIGNPRIGIRSTDLGYYREDHLPSAPGVLSPAVTEDRSKATTELVRRLVLEIRSLRPDLMVVEDILSKRSLEAASAVATQNAIQLAASPSFRLFSPASGLEMPAWTVQRVLARSSEPGGLVLPPSMLMNSTGVLLGEAMHTTMYLAEDDGIAGAMTRSRISYRPMNHRSSSMTQPLDGLILDSATLRIEPVTHRRKLSTTMASASAPTRVAQLLKTRGAGLRIENAWDEMLRELASEVVPDVMMDELWSVAIQSRRAGNWHRWNTAINMLLEKSPEGPMAELAYGELMGFFGSPEIQRMLQDQLAELQANRIDPADSKATPSGNTTSPFATRETNIALAAYETQNRLTPIARFRGIETFTRILTRWPDGWQSMRNDPQWAWLITSRYRTRMLLRGSNLEDSRQSLYWPPFTPQIQGWSELHVQERALVEPNANPIPLPNIPFVTDRPYLDGQADEPLWNDAQSLYLSSFWASEAPGTRIRLARDADFLFVHCHAPKRINAAGENAPKISKKHPNQSKQRDALDPALDHVRMRLDLDRDYATWFEFSWDCEGETLERCNDMPGWNPTWFVAFDTQSDAWNAEIAIPLSSILPQPLIQDSALESGEAVADEVVTAVSTRSEDDLSNIAWEQQVWALSIVRERPSEPLESLIPSASDRWSRDQWQLISPRLEQSLPPAK